MNVENLITLANYLESGALRAEFDMALFTNHPTGQICGTAGCAVGHGPHAGIRKTPWESWLPYSYRVFGLDPLHDARIWAWCFSDEWASVDNTPQGCARRIRYMLRHGVPANWNDSWGGWAEWKAPEFAGTPMPGREEEIA